jgi:hypothetical protein
MSRVVTAALAAIIFLLALPAHAHKPSDSYLSLKAEGKAVSGQWDIALRDLDFAIGLDQDGNGELTWDEVRARHPDIGAYALARLKLSNGGQPCPLKVTQHLLDNHSDGAYAVLRLTASCAADIDALAIDYGLLFDVDRQHKGLLRLERAGQSSSAIFTPDNRRQTFTHASNSGWRQFADYVRHGVWHIWIGFDHILFLLSLLMPAVLVYGERSWIGAASFRSAVVEVLKVVTAFTLAHSITLTLAALGVVTLPSRFVESAIAASVALAALNNVWPWYRGPLAAVAFVFGLIHGFGFASVLADLGLPKQSLLLSLVGFNVGVELGQVAIVAVFLPLAYAIRDTFAYRKVIVLGGSCAITALALAWVAERVFDLRLMP